MKSTILIPIILQLAGVVVIIAEFLLPSFGILTITACGLFGYSIYYVFAHFTNPIGVAFVLVDSVLIPFLVVVGIKLLSQSRFSLKTELSQKDGVTSQAGNLINLVGLSGKTATILRPAGKAVIDQKKYDVVSVGDYIGQNEDVEVVEVSGNRIIVRRK
jgi:membrane-bound serine protease (ClpP class)